jgi:hypothetical protein
MPKPGNVSLCARCGEYSFFDKGLKLRKPTHEETAALMDDPMSQFIRASMKLTHAKMEGNTTARTLGLYIWDRATDEVRAARDPREWKTNFEQGELRRVSTTLIAGVGVLMTSFIGIDQSVMNLAGAGEERRLFETALQYENCEDGVDVIAQYPNPEDARQSHERIVVALMERHAETVEQAREIIAAVRMRGDE